MRKNFKNVSFDTGICPFCNEEIENFLGICPVCGEKISFFSKILGILKSIKVTKPQNNNNNKTFNFKKFIKYISIILISVFCILFTVYFTNKTINQNPIDLYKTWNDTDITFIDETGNPIFSFALNKYDYVGNFFDGVLFVGNIIKPSDGKPPYQEVVKLTMIDTNGNIIKELRFNYFKGPIDGLPIFYKGYAHINNDIYIDKSGEFVFHKNIPPEVDKVIKMVKSEYIPEGYSSAHRLQYATHTPDKTNLHKHNMHCENHYYFCANFIDNNGKVIIKKHIMENLSDFYNGLLVVDQQGQTIKSYYIKLDGTLLNNTMYDWAEPFTRKLAFVQKGKDYGYINTNGDWIWKITSKNGYSNEIFMYSGHDTIESYIESTKFVPEKNDEYYDYI